MAFTKKEQEIIDGAFIHYKNEIILCRKGNVHYLSHLFKVNSLPGKIDNDGIIVRLTDPY